MANVQESAIIVDWKDCPLVEVIPGKVSGVPLLKGTRMPADVVVENYHDGLPAEESQRSSSYQLQTCASCWLMLSSNNPRFNREDTVR